MMTKRNTLLWYHWLAITFFILLILNGCTQQLGDPSDKNGMSVLRVSPLPDQSPEILRKQYQPLLDYLSRKTGLKTELIITSSYSEMLELFHNNEIDLAYFGALTYLKANKHNQAVPLVFRDVDLEFSSVILAHRDSTIQSINDLKGKSFCFGSKLSTSGHLMPRYYLSHLNIEPESYFSRIEYSGTHDKTAYWVRDKKVDAGVANSNIINSMFRNGLLNNSEIKIIWETPHYADYVWASHIRIPNKINSLISNAFLSLQKEKAEHLNILNNLGANYYVSANKNDFDLVESVVNDLFYKGIIE